MASLSTVAAIAMAIGAPLVYADQAWSIAKKRNAEGFSKDVSAILLIANICRCFFWLGERFEFALLLQSLLMIVAQLYLLWLCIRYRPGSYASSAFTAAPSDAEFASSGRAAQSPSTHLQPQAQPMFNFTVTPASPSEARSPSEVESATRIGGNRAQSQGQSPSGLIDSAMTHLGVGGRNGRGAGGVGGRRGRYSPLLSFNLPTAPTLNVYHHEGDNEDEDAEGDQAPFLRRSKTWLKAVMSVGNADRADGSSGKRIFGFWTWPDYSSYILFLLLLVALLGLLHLIFGRLSLYISLLGFFALGLESTLPIPQAVQNFERKSLAGFRSSVLIGWFGGDLFKTIYFLINRSPLQFTVCALFQLSVDALIFAQMRMYAEQTAKDEETQARSAAEAMEASERERAVIGDEGVRQAPMLRTPAPAARGTGMRGETLDSEGDHTIFQIEADDDEEGDDGRSKGSGPQRSKGRP